MTRKEYQKGVLTDDELSNCPFEQFEKWFNDAKNTTNIEPNAFALASCTPGKYPGIRMLLMKSFDSFGFIFASNYESRKGKELASENKASMLFYWPELERQIRIEGDVSIANQEVSDQIFNSRPRGSQIAALTSPQSQELESRMQLEDLYEKTNLKYADQELKRPSNWGAYLLAPINFEFWQGRENRLHDRITYKKQANLWLKLRIAP